MESGWAFGKLTNSKKRNLLYSPPDAYVPVLSTSYFVLTIGVYYSKAHQPEYHIYVLVARERGLSQRWNLC
jgi:hypothetical protein